MARHADTKVTISMIRSKLDQVQAYVRPSEFRTEAERIEDIEQGRLHLLNLQLLLLDWFNQEAAKPTKAPRD